MMLINNQEHRHRRGKEVNLTPVSVSIFYMIHATTSVTETFERLDGIPIS